VINDMRDNLFMQRALIISKKLRYRFIEFAKDTKCTFLKSFASFLENDAFNVFFQYTSRTYTHYALLLYARV